MTHIAASGMCDNEECKSYESEADLLAAVLGRTIEVLGMSGCPCFIVHLPDGDVLGHCWRTGPQKGGCGFEPGPLSEEGITALKAVLDDLDWYGEWSVIR